jgi:hypothetical protein
MTDREPNHGRAPEPLTALERSLREGPTDEGGYHAEAIDFSTDVHGESRVGLPAGRRSVGIVRRPRSMNPIFSYIGSAAVLVVILFGGFTVLQRVSQAGSSPSPQSSSLQSPGGSPIPVPGLTETFVSTRNGFSVRYPAGWSTKAATSSWRPNTYVPIGNSALDELKQQGEARLEVASQRLAPGQTEASWLASFNQPYDLGFCTGDRTSWPRLSVDGQLGYLDVEACPASADTRFSIPDLRFDVLVFSGGRVYEITLDGIVDRAYFEAVLATVHLDPASAIDPPEGT